MSHHPTRLSRRRLLTTAAAGVTLAAAPWSRAADDRINPYLESHARESGGYAFADQERAHLTPTFAVIGCYRLLKTEVPNKAKLIEFVRDNHPSRLKKLEQERRSFEWQQAQALVWLDADPAELREKVRPFIAPLPYLKQYERHGYPVFRSEASVIMTRSLLGLNITRELIDYVLSRRRANGSFNNTPATDGGDGNVLNTWWGLSALRIIVKEQENKQQTIAWLRACQTKSGGFTHAPQPQFAAMDDVAYASAAARGLALLGAQPDNRDAAVAWLLSLANDDGGFADRPGWQSNPLATYYALDALDALNALPDVHRVPRQPAPAKPALPDGLRVWSIQLEAHGVGSPAEAVDLAQSLRIHLWGAKNAKPEWIARAQAIADARKASVTFFVSNEEYGTWVDVPGMGTYSHTSDIIAPAGAQIGATLANHPPATWEQFREQRLTPLQKAGGRLIWQFGENEELVRLFLDDSLLRGGYSAISTFHFGNPDFTNSEPFLHRWRGQIPFVTLQDAHGREPWWFADMTEGFRTVFLAKEPTWTAWLEALKNNWTLAIRRDALSGMRTWMHAGSRQVLDFVKARANQWQWWDSPEIARPIVSLVAVRSDDEFETARPEAGAVLRIRCAWQNTAQGLPKQPIAELVKLELDGAAVEAKQTVLRNPRGAVTDAYHVAPLAKGRHRATATVRVIAAGKELPRSIDFEV